MIYNDEQTRLLLRGKQFFTDCGVAFSNPDANKIEQIATVAVICTTLQIPIVTPDDCSHIWAAVFYTVGIMVDEEENYGKALELVLLHKKNRMIIVDDEVQIDIPDTPKDTPDNSTVH